MAISADLTATASPSDSDGGSGMNSPNGRRRGSLPSPSPWSNIVVVRGSESTSAPVAAAAPRSPRITAADAVPLDPPDTGEFQPEGSDDGNGNGNGDAARSKKPAWNKPLNGVVDGTSVMGGSVSWPALSESTKSTGKSSSDSLKALSDGSTSTSQGPIISQTPPKPANTNVNTNSGANHGMTRQRSVKHRGGGSAQGGGFNRPPPPTPPPMPPPFPALIELPTYGNYGNFVPPVLDSSVRGARPLSGVGSQSSNDHSTHSQRNSSRRNNFGGRSRGDGQYHNNHGGRRDHDRRDVHLPHQFVPSPPPGGYMPPPPPPPPGSASFIAPPPPMRSFGPLGFDMAPPYMYVPTLPFIAPAAPPAPMYFSVVDPSLAATIVKQIDYYFSDDNLVRDNYLRLNMDGEGWVPIDLIASFPRVKCWTNEIPVVLESLRSSMVVEVKEQGDKIRRRNDWKRWIRFGSSHVSLDSASWTPGTSSDDVLTNSINKISLNEVAGSKKGVSDLIDSEKEPSRGRLPEDSVRTSIVANGDVPAETFLSS